MSKVGQRLINAAKEAAAIAKGEKKAAHYWVPADVDVRAIRRKVEMPQEEFASEFGFTVSQIRDWEQGRTRPLGAMRAYLLIIEQDPDSVRRLLKASIEVAA